MKHVGHLPGVVLLLLVSIHLSSVRPVYAQSQPAEALVHAVHGTATTLIAGSWQPLQENTRLAAGATLKTAGDTTIDLFLTDSGTILRLLPNSLLRFDRLDEMPGAERPVTTTRLALVAGSLLGSQRKLVGASKFEVEMATGVAKIVGTEYLVRADGAVTVLSGSVTVHYNLPGNRGSVRVEVSAGFSFDPALGRAVPTTGVYLQNIIAHVQAIRGNSRVFRIGRATLVVDPTERPVSPTHPGHPPHPPHPPHPDHPDQDNGHGDGNGHGRRN